VLLPMRTRAGQGLLVMVEECSVPRFLARVLGQNSGDKACEEIAAIFWAGGEYFTKRQGKE